MFELNPEREKSRRLLSLDKPIVESRGCHHKTADGEVYLDFVAQCGAVPFGHNPDFLVTAIKSYLDRGGPNFFVPLSADAPVELGRALCRHAHGGFERCVLTNSGAESAEVAIKIARAKTKRRKTLSTENSFHGKTYATLCATGTEAYRKPFAIESPEFAHVPFQDLDALERALSGREVAAFIVEPVQGEGGMVVARRDYLREAKKLCERHGTLLIIDEIQTGLGRTGYFTASEYFEVAPDMMLLAKALGGGLVPIGACLATAEAWTAEFAMAHSSTFGGNGLCAAVGLEVVRALLENEGQLLAHVRETGAHLGAGLRRLVETYPTVYKEATGMGLMHALHLQIQKNRRGHLMNFLGSPVISSYLLNRHRIVTFLALNRKEVLRLEPALILGKAEVEQLLAALADVGAVLSGDRFEEIYSYVRS